MAFNFGTLFKKEEDEYITDDRESVEETEKIKILEPRAFSESKQIADYLKKKNGVIVNLKRVTPDQGKRIVDFLNGTLYALGGVIQKLGNGIFLCTPKNIGVEGEISTDLELKNKKDDDSFDF